MNCIYIMYIWIGKIESIFLKNKFSYPNHKFTILRNHENPTILIQNFKTQPSIYTPIQNPEHKPKADKYFLNFILFFLEKEFPKQNVHIQTNI